MSGFIGPLTVANKRTLFKQNMRRGKALKKLNPREKKQVKRIVRFGKELKFITNTSNYFTSIPLTPALVIPMTDVPQAAGNSTDQNRIGDQIEICGNIDIWFQLLNAAGATGDSYNTIRMLIVQFKDSVSGNPAASNFLLNGPSGGLDPWSCYNMDHRLDYTIIYDKLWSTVGPAASSPTSLAPNYVHNRHLVLRTKRLKKRLQFVGGSTTIGTNRIFAIFLSDSSATSHPSLVFSSRVLFRDA